jgi:hypothetical protein
VRARAHVCVCVRACVINACLCDVCVRVCVLQFFSEVSVNICRHNVSTVCKGSQSDTP